MSPDCFAVVDPRLRKAESGLEAHNLPNISIYFQIVPRLQYLRVDLKLFHVEQFNYYKVNIE